MWPNLTFDSILKLSHLGSQKLALGRNSSCSAICEPINGRTDGELYAAMLWVSHFALTGSSEERNSVGFFCYHLIWKEFLLSVMDLWKDKVSLSQKSPMKVSSSACPNARESVTGFNQTWDSLGRNSGSTVRKWSSLWEACLYWSMTI